MKGQRTHIELFAGLGGFGVASEQLGWKMIAWVEKNKYCQSVLQKRFPQAHGYTTHNTLNTIAMKHNTQKLLTERTEALVAEQAEKLYYKMVDNMRLNPEERGQMINRLSEDRIKSNTAVS